MELTIMNLEKSYDRPVLKGVTHTFCGGGLYVVKGVSGCGKSTLLNILGGLETDFRGRIDLDGEALEGHPERLRALCGTIYQQSLLLSGLTVRENLLLIRNDADRAEELCRELGVAELLDRLPEELSGGERQRVSTARALLREPKILLADEPTASLDERNSRKIARFLYDLRREDRIILAATHEHCFDDLADEILDLRYGQIASVRAQTQTPAPPPASNRAPAPEPKPLGTVRYNLCRGRRSRRPAALLPFALIFLILMLVSTVQNAFFREFILFLRDDYPVDAFDLTPAAFSALPEPYRGRLKVYEEYEAAEGDVRAFYLAGREDSVLAIRDMLEYGRFPESPDEVLVTAEYARGYGSAERLVGERIAFLGREFTVSGVLYDIDWTMSEEDHGDGRNRDFYLYLLGDGYYKRDPDGPGGRITGKRIFIPYETLRTFGERVQGRSVRCVYPGLFLDGDAYNAVKRAVGTGENGYRETPLNSFDQKIGAMQDALDTFTAVLSLALGVSFAIACVFISAQVRLELFYRRRELGFLQIFGLERRRVKRTVLTGYALKLVLSLGLSLVLYALLWVGYLLITGHPVLFDPLYTLAAASVISLLYLAAVSRASSHFLRRSVLKLVTS